MTACKDIDFHLFIESLARTIELKDAYTAGHSRRGSEYAELLCRKMGKDEESCVFIHIIGHLHDLGKIGIAEGVLLKPGRLSEAEYLLMQQHAVIGASIFANLPGLEGLAAIIRQHHERFDGKGYPDQLRGEQIPLESAIIALADSFDAMTTFRTYKPSLSFEQAVDELRRKRETQFHPELCDLFVELCRDEQDTFDAVLNDCPPVAAGYLSFDSVRSISLSEPCAVPRSPFDKGNRNFLSIRNEDNEEYTVGYEPEFTAIATSRIRNKLSPKKRDR